MKNYKILAATTAAAVTIACANTIPVNAAEKNFSDVKANDWYYDAVQECANAGIVNGYPNGSFQPNALVTTAEALTMVYRAYDIDVNKQNESAYWANDTLKYAFDNNTLANTACSYFDELNDAGKRFYLESVGNSSAPRKSVAKMIVTGDDMDTKLYYNYDVSTVNDWENAFSDPDYSLYVGTAWVYGILNGDTDGNINADKGITRAELCTMLSRTLNSEASVKRGNVGNGAIQYQVNFDYLNGKNDQAIAGVCQTMKIFNDTLDAKFLTLFANNGWHVEVTVIGSEFPDINGAGAAIGMTDYHNHVIYVDATKYAHSAVHEMGHALAFLYGEEKLGYYDAARTDDFRAIYEEEHENFTTASEHERHNADEFWAAVFTDMMYGKTAVAEMCPKATEYIMNAYASYCA